MSRYIDAEKIEQFLRTQMDMQDLYLPIHFVEAIEDMPTADVQEVEHGEWKTSTAYEMFGGDEECWYAHGDPIVSLYCSVCGFEPYASGALSLDYEAIEAISNHKFCPHCGARMDGD